MPKIHDTCYMDELERRICEDCFSGFIVGIQRTKQEGEPKCPYCGGKTHAMARIIDYDTLNYLGCGGLTWHITEDGKLIDTDEWLTGAEKLNRELRNSK